jgi:hypothetical protein
MSLGIPIGKNDLDNRTAYIVQTARELFELVDRIKTGYLDTVDDATLLAMQDNQGRTWTQAEVDALRGIYSSFSKLGKIAHSQDVQPGTSNFFFDADQLHVTGLS